MPSAPTTVYANSASVSAAAVQVPDPEDEMLGFETMHGDGDANVVDHSITTAPIFTRDVLDVVGINVLPQRALYGRVISQHAPGFPNTVENAKVYVNTNAPFSGLVCGVQGSGKSHTTSVLLESCLIKDSRIGTLPAPLSGLVFHFDTAAGGGAVQPCEAAYLAAIDSARGDAATPPTVTVLVMPNNLNAMRQVYPGLPNVVVAPLHFAANDISGERLLAMMKVDVDQQMPLYMEAIMTILRSMERFDYQIFRDELKAQKFAPSQKAMLNLRLSLLDACLKGGNATNRVSTHFRQGHLTIIDLSSPFMDASSACSFFDIILGLFVEARTVSSAKLVVLDEAHKYLSDTGSSSRLTESLLSVIRQQRHLNMRVLISTQEPTVVPSKFLDLCSFVIAHRFSSPQWLKHLSQHVSAADSLSSEWFSKVVSLRTGEAMLFAPSGLGVKEVVDADDDFEDLEPRRVAALGQGYLLVRSRLRITCDGGQSLLAVADDRTPTRLGPVIVDHSSAGTVPTATFVQSTIPPTSGISQSTGQPTTAASSLAPESRATSPASSTSSATIVEPISVGSSELHKPGPVAATQTTKQAPSVPAQFVALIAYLREQRRAGTTRVSWSVIGQRRRKNNALYSGKLANAMEAARAAGLVKLGHTGGGWAEVAPEL